MDRYVNTVDQLPNPAGSRARFQVVGRDTRPPAPTDRQTPPSLLTAVKAYIDSRGGAEGYYPTPVRGLGVMQAFRHVDANHTLYRPSLCVVLQGAKEIVFGEQTLSYGSMQGLIVSVEMPACGKIVQASPGQPFIGVTVDFDVAVMLDVLRQLDSPPRPAGDSGPSLFVADIHDRLADCVTRLLQMCDTPDAIAVLAPAAMREIYYWLLVGPYGGELCRMALPDTHMDRIARAITLLRASYANPLTVETLAMAAGMSPSAFHRHFKALTSMSPLQFQKQLRLLEARRLMVADAANVAEAAYQVGYESASQFSREYLRAFGITPKRDVTSRKAELEYAATA